MQIDLRIRKKIGIHVTFWQEIHLYKRQVQIVLIFVLVE